MPKAAEPLSITFFATGLYTHRSQLFSPYRAIGVNVVTYHDAAIDGQDMEIDSTLQWTRRPGFSRFCSQAFATGEFPLQFYSARQPAGTVVAFVDTNQNFSFFTTTAITSIVTKSTTAQGFIQQVGQMTYYANGKDLKKWNGASVSGWGVAAPTTRPFINNYDSLHGPRFWSPDNFGANSSSNLFLDYNGNIQQNADGFGGGQSGAAEPVWAATTSGTPFQPVYGILTKDNLGTYFLLGSYTSAVWGASKGVTADVAFTSISSVIIDPAGNLQICTTAGTTGATVPSFNSTFGGTTTDGTATWTCFGAASLSVQSGYTYAYGYRTIWGQLSTLSPLLTIGAIMGALSIPLKGMGTGDAQCSQSVTITNVVIDSNNNLTITYSGAPLNLVAGQNYTLSGLTTATFLNGKTVLVSSIGTNSFTGFFQHAAYTSAPDTGTAAFNGVEIYRTADGGGVLYYDASLPNPGAGVTWIFTDTNPDTSLVTTLIGPLAHLNDPPPGTSGSLVTTGGTILAYWQGRIWMAVGNKLYFDAGPDCINGVPEESWPPANVFQYPGPITGLSPTSQGLLVWGADYLSMALGGPQTLSFFPYDLMKNFGVSSPNCLAQDGDTISAITTAGQCFTLTDTGKSETGNYIVNLLSTFAPTGSYVSIHRQGTDAGLWLGDGSTNLFRYSLNIGAWSTEYKPVGGIGALRSVETSVGVYTLCAGRTTGAGYILGRNLSAWQDDGQSYPNAFVTIGSITLTQPGATLVPVQHIVGYFDAVGTLGPTGSLAIGGPTIPTVAILPNEISGSSGVGFLTLGQPKSEYTTTQQPTASLLSLRWDVDSMSVQSLVSQWMHHLQIRISFPPENAPNSIKSLSIMLEKDA